MKELNDQFYKNLGGKIMSKDEKKAIKKGRDEDLTRLRPWPKPPELRKKPPQKPKNDD